MNLAGDNTTGATKRTQLLAAIAVAVAMMTRKSAALQTTSPQSGSLQTPKPAAVRRVLVSLPDRKLALLHNGQIVKIYRVAVGKPSTPSPVGEFKIVNRIVNPAYYHKGQVVPAGKGNPVGSRWMGLSARSYGIHGTNQPNSIGKAASTGCIRMSKRDLEELFTLVEVGDAVEIRAERDEDVAAIFGPSTETVAAAQSESVNQAEAGGGQ